MYPMIKIKARNKLKITDNTCLHNFEGFNNGTILPITMMEKTDGQNNWRGEVYVIVANKTEAIMAMKKKMFSSINFLVILKLHKHDSIIMATIKIIGENKTPSKRNADFLIILSMLKPPP